MSQTSAAPRVGPMKVALAVGLGGALNPLNGTLLNTSFVTIALAFGLSFGEVSYLLPLYLAFTAGFQPFAGSVGDRVGRRRAFLWAIFVFAVVSTGAAFSPSFGVLAACRCVQAVCSAVIMPNGAALIRDAVAEESQGKALGLMGALVGVAAGIGFPLGGAIASSLGWRALFWVNAPLGLLALGLAARFLPRGGRGGAQVSPLSVVGLPLMPLVVGMELVNRQAMAALGRGLVVASAVMTLVIAVALVRSSNARREAKQIGTRPYVASLVVFFLQGAIMYTAFLILPTWVADALSIDTHASGLYLAMIIGVMVFASPIAGGLADRFGTRPPALLGITLLIGALICFGWVSSAPPRWLVLAGLLLFGAGFSFTLTPVQRGALQSAPVEASGLAMGLLSSARYFGGILGTALVAVAIGDASTVGVAEGEVVFRNLTLFAALPALAAAFMIPAANVTTEKR